MRHVFEFAGCVRFIIEISREGTLFASSMIYLKYLSRVMSICLHPLVIGKVYRFCNGISDLYIK